MRGYLLFVFGLGGLIVFTTLLFTAGNLFIFWLFLEMSTLCLVPLFFLNSECLNLSGLFSYLVVSSISSSLMISGILFESFLILFVVGLLVKFGIFPFFGWVYKVVLGSNWCVIWGLSTMLKSAFFIFPFLLLGGWSHIISVFCMLSFLVLLVLFWVYTCCWELCWGHMMLSSSVCLVAMSGSLEVSSLFEFFVVYVMWSSAVILCLSRQSEFCLSGVGSSFLFAFLLVSFPFSISMFYKFLLSGYMFSCYFGIFFFWCVYTVSEQLYLIKFFIDTSIPRSAVGFIYFV